MDRELLHRKCEDLERTVSALEQAQGKSLEEIRASLLTSWGIEHGLQLAIQTLLDIGAHILASSGEHRVEDYGDVIDRLGERGVIPKDFARKIRKMASFRNLLVHEYAEIDLATVHDVLHNRLEDFQQFIRHVQSYLASWESGT